MRTIRVHDRRRDPFAVRSECRGQDAGTIGGEAGAAAGIVVADTAQRGPIRRGEDRLGAKLAPKSDEQDLAVKGG